MYSLMTKPLTLMFYEISGNFYGFAFTALVLAQQIIWGPLGIGIVIGIRLSSLWCMHLHIAK